MQTALTASLCPGPCTLGLQGDMKTIHSKLSGKSFSLSDSPAILEGWDPNPYPYHNACSHPGSLSWSPALHLALDFPPSQGCTSLSSLTDSKRSFGVALVAFREQTASRKLAATLGLRGPAQTWQMEDRGVQWEECAHVISTATRREAEAQLCRGAKQRATSALGLKEVACAACQRQRRANKKLIKLLMDVFSTID